MQSQQCGLTPQCERDLLKDISRGKRREEAPSDVKPRPGFTLPFAELVINVVQQFQNVKTNLLSQRLS
jgi:hypothetical protein